MTRSACRGHSEICHRDTEESCLWMTRLPEGGALHIGRRAAALRRRATRAIGLFLCLSVAVANVLGVLEDPGAL